MIFFKTLVLSFLVSSFASAGVTDPKYNYATCIARATLSKEFYQDYKIEHSANRDVGNEYFATLYIDNRKIETKKIDAINDVDGSKVTIRFSSGYRYERSPEHGTWLYDRKGDSTPMDCSN